MNGRFSYIYDAIDPAPIDQQIKAQISVIERTSRVLEQRVARGDLHPAVSAQKMHQLRSILVTLQRVQQGALVPNPNPTTPPVAQQVHA